jgi:hypothetical protein
MLEGPLSAKDSRWPCRRAGGQRLGLITEGLQVKGRQVGWPGQARSFRVQGGSASTRVCTLCATPPQRRMEPWSWPGTSSA